MIKLATIWPVWPDNCLLTIAEQTGYEYSGFWIIMVLTMALNPCCGSFTVRALSCPQPYCLLPLELVDLVRLVPLLVKAICMLSGQQPFFLQACVSPGTVSLKFSARLHLCLPWSHCRTQVMMAGSFAIARATHTGLFSFRLSLFPQKNDFSPVHVIQIIKAFNKMVKIEGKRGVNDMQ